MQGCESDDRGALLASSAALPDTDRVDGEEVTMRRRDDEVDTLLEVRDLSVAFDTPTGTLHAVSGVSYRVGVGEIVAIIGESGSGKTVSSETVMGILDSPPGRILGGEVLYQGEDLLKMSPKRRRALRGEDMAMVFQDALTALNPSITVGKQIGEMFRVHRGTSRSEARELSIAALKAVGIPAAEDRVDDYPMAFSGGMRQRVMIAMAIALEPTLIIADEPTTALDVTVQAQIVELLRDLCVNMGTALILVTHDLGLAAEIADSVVVMYAGRVAERGPVDEVFRSTAHPYTRALMEAVPRIDRKVAKMQAIGGAVPDLRSLPTGCPFHPRCPLVAEVCRSEVPDMRQVTSGHRSACHRFEELLADDR